MGSKLEISTIFRFLEYFEAFWFYWTFALPENKNSDFLQLECSERPETLAIDSTRE